MDDKELARMRYWMDRLEIQDCINRYPRGLDRHDDDFLASVFWPDAVDNHGAWVGERDAFVEWANHACHDAFSGHAHNLTSHTCEIDGDTAHAETYVIFVLRQREGTNVEIGGGRYVDRLEKRDGEWRIALRRLAMDWRIDADGGRWFKDKRPYPPGTWDRTDISYQRPLDLPENLREELDRKHAAE
ncbi:MAG TPA: nuclear transport factor 2 family protein [Rhizobiaceae bacterium]|nr:nuclear transport factor 2 family protein [Rhizobiaceae bacterium]